MQQRDCNQRDYDTQKVPNFPPLVRFPFCLTPYWGRHIGRCILLFRPSKTDVRTLPVPHLRSPYWLGHQGELIWARFLDAFESICEAELSSIFWSAYAVRVAEGNEGGRCVNTRKTHPQHRGPASVDWGLDHRRHAHLRASVRLALISTSCFTFLIHPFLIFLSLHACKQARMSGWGRAPTHARK